MRPLRCCWQWRVTRPQVGAVPRAAAQPPPPLTPPAPLPICVHAPGGVIRLVTISKEGAQRRLILPEEHEVLWDELPEPRGMVV